jgi:biotin carboxyl carrier protein
MSVVTVANPTSDEWLQWAGNNGVCPEVMAFAKQTPEIFDCYVDLEKGAKNPYIFNPMAGVVKGFCSPRSLAKASNIISQRAVLGSAVLPALAGTIGEPAARQMEALINLADQLPLFEQIVKAPATTKIPKGAGALFLLAFMLAGRVNADSMDAVMEYGERISKESFEAHSLLIMTLASNKTKVSMACSNRAFTAAAAKLVKALRERFDVPVHLHTHDTAGGQLATLMAAIDAGVDAVDVASAPMAGTTSQPSASALVAALADTERDSGIPLDSVTALEPYWEAVRLVYSPFESGLPGPTGRVYKHEIPGGQLSNLRQQAIALGLGNQFERVEDMYAAANRILGRPTKVTPSSKVVGDLALHLVAVGADPDDFAENPQNYDVPDSVIGFMAGELGDLPGGWPEPFRTKVLQGKSPKFGLTPVSAEDLAKLTSDDARVRRSTLNRLLFAGPTAEFEKARENFGNLDEVDTVDYLYGLEQGREHVVQISKGIRLYVGLEAIGTPDAKGFRTVMATLNGQLRPINIRDRKIATDVVLAEKADPNNLNQVSAPFQGVVTIQTVEGAHVEVGQAVATIEAMKMEATITASTAGVVRRIAIAKTQRVDAGDLLLVVEAE